MPLSPISERVLRQVTWGTWTSRDAICEIVGPMVPPGRALREYESSEEWNRAKKLPLDQLSHPERSHERPPASEGQKIRRGQRALVIVSINSLKSSGRLECTTIDGTCMVRRVERRLVPELSHPELRMLRSILERAVVMTTRQLSEEEQDLLNKLTGLTPMPNSASGNMFVSSPSVARRPA